MSDQLFVINQEEAQVLIDVAYAELKGLVDCASLKAAKRKAAKKVLLDFKDGAFTSWSCVGFAIEGTIAGLKKALPDENGGLFDVLRDELWELFDAIK
ncbi:hypothetical protein ACFL2R_01610 [Patescibacteria group bacterium]